MIKRKSARIIGAVFGALAAAATLVAYANETSVTLKGDLMILIVAIVVGVGLATIRK